MKKQGILTIISGFSGVGKGTIVSRLLEKYPQDYCLSISATTRAPREGEKDGVNYFFVSKTDFEKMIREERLLEYARYVDNYYGTPKDFVLDQLAKGVHVILEIEMQGAKKIKAQYPQTLMIFVAPPKASDLKDRLMGRGTESQEQIKSRLARAAQESVYMEDYEYIVVNDQVERAVEEIHQIIANEQDRTQRQGEFISQLTKELNQMYDAMD
ncbi:MAG TPA: guanylate kinase [Candidatus Scybalocola faecavium]|nr:guanylate kinase [Candidatus Scybalocola faecavium]